MPSSRKVPLLASIAVALVVLIAACTPPAPDPAPLSTHVIAEGLNLHLVYANEGKLVEVDSASIPSAGLLPEHAVFNVVKHPSKPWLYAASTNDCGVSTSACWGNGRIDRFVVENDSITHDGAAFLYDLSAPVGVTCAHEAVPPALVGQVGYCSPNGMVFSADGSRFYVDDDDLDGIHIFEVDASGNLAFIAEGAVTESHGLTIDPTGSYLYNGSSVIGVSGDVPTAILFADPGNATALVDLGGQAGLISTVSTEAVAIYDLVDPQAPATVATLAMARNEARDLDFDASLARIVVAGRNTVQTATFDGAGLTLLDTYTATDVLNTEYRGVALANGSDAAIAVWFQVAADDSITGGAHLFSIAADGSLSQVDAVDYSGRGTTVLQVR